MSGSTPGPNGRPSCRRTSCNDRARRPAGGRGPCLRAGAGAGRCHARPAGGAHGGGDRPRRGGQVEPLLARRRGAQGPVRPHRRAGRRHLRRRAPRRCAAAHRLHAAGAGAEPLSHALRHRECRFLRPALRPGRGRARRPDCAAAGGHGAGPLRRPAGAEAVGRHEAEARALLRADPRPRPADPRRADHRRRPRCRAASSGS